eukprot:5902448-Lingulodinium_polyedra.AAC.1
MASRVLENLCEGGVDGGLDRAEVPESVPEPPCVHHAPLRFSSALDALRDVAIGVQGVFDRRILALARPYVALLVEDDVVVIVSQTSAAWRRGPRGLTASIPVPRRREGATGGARGFRERKRQLGGVACLSPPPPPTVRL